MKKIFVFFMAAMISLSWGGSFAEESEREPDIIAENLIEVSNKQLISQTDKKALISFDIKNTQNFYYPSLYYIVSLGKMEEVAKDAWFSRTILDYEPVEFEIGPSQQKTISYSCEFPENLPIGEYCLEISFFEKNHEVSAVPETIILNSMGTQKEFLEGVGGDYLTVDGEIEGSLTGPNVTVDSNLKAYFSVKSSFDETHTFIPKIVVYKRNNIYNSEPISMKYGSSIEIKPEEVKKIELDLPIMTKPESYLVKVCLLDETLKQVSVQHSFRYVTTGVSANVKAFEITFDDNNDIVADLWVIGPADGSELNGCVVEFEIKFEDGTVIDSKKEILDLCDASSNVSIVFDRNKIGDTNKIIVSAKVLYDDKTIVEEERIVNIDSITSEQEKFSDISGTKYEEAVTLLNGLGILNGYPDGTFRPENTITRAEFASIMVKINELKFNEDDESKFWDVTPEYWAKNYINACSDNGLVSGYTDGSFKPGNNVNYAEAITMLVNALKYKEEVAEMELGWPYNYIGKSTELGLHNNIESADFFSAATRGDVAILTMNAYLMK